eukprot:gene3818-biopygen9278
MTQSVHGCSNRRHSRAITAARTVSRPDTTQAVSLPPPAPAAAAGLDDWLSKEMANAAAAAAGADGSVSAFADTLSSAKARRFEVL